MQIPINVVRAITENLPDMPAPEKTVLYGSMEVLPGRCIGNNLLNVPGSDELRASLRKDGIFLNALEELEPEPRLGNGGLGRLAACLIESASALKVPLEVNTIRFRSGLFRQSIDAGGQHEEPDTWLDEDGRYPFEIPKPDESVLVHFDGCTVRAVPYDIPVWGAGSEPHVNFIRTWAVDELRCEEIFRPYYLRIDGSLYPDDSDREGKLLRLRQEYFLSACIVGNMVNRLKKNGWSVKDIPDHFVLHINDTHCALMICELMRILRDEGLTIEEAVSICEKTFVYTNHTVMTEALEQLDLEMTSDMSGRIASQINNLNRHYCRIIREKFPGDSGKMQRLEIVSGNNVHMARLAVWVSRTTNGVAAIHTEILRRSLFSDFFELFPERFVNVTNGVTHRRWLAHANPPLAVLLDSAVGKEWRRDFSRISLLSEKVDDGRVQTAYRDLHYSAKRRLREYIFKKRGISIPADFIFDVQVKRFHQYKRQLLNVLKILALYNRLKSEPDMEFQPTAFIFAGKAAASYDMAKAVIRLILALEQLINNDPDINSKLMVAFVPDYGVTAAEIIIPAADISEQISTAGTEASGTGCMKMMINGAVTLGTMDGANVEIFERLCGKGIYTFGASAKTVKSYSEVPGSYNARYEISRCPELRSALDTLSELRSSAPDANGDFSFKLIMDELTSGEFGNAPDRFYVLRDFEDYYRAFLELNRAFGRGEVLKMSLHNIASSAFFSSDRMVAEYCSLVWDIGYK